MKWSWVCWVVMGVAQGVGAQDEWAQFRGPGGAGAAAAGAAYPVEFGPERAVEWRVEVPMGHSSPCISGDRIFLTAAEELQLLTLCLDRVTGAELWRRAVEVGELERMHRINTAASATAATDGERVYVSFGSFGLLCYDVEGKELWRRELGVAKNTFGTAASPITIGGRVAFVRDTNEGSFLELIDGSTGETVWKVDRTQFKSGWSTPMYRKVGDAEELVVYGIWWVTGYDLSDGSERWSVPGLADEPCITPVTGDGHVFVTSYNMRTNPEVLGLPDWAALLAELDQDDDGALSRDEAAANESVLSRSDADGEGDHPLRIFFRFLDGDRDGKLVESEWGRLADWLNTFEHKNALVAIRPGAADQPAEIAWQHGRGIPECPSPLYHEGRIILVKNGGLVTCLDAGDGSVHFEGRLGAGGPYYASPVVGGGRVYAASARGVVTVFAAGDELDVLAHNDLEDRIMATPALVDGRVYIRTESHLFAFGEAAD